MPKKLTAPQLPEVVEISPTPMRTTAAGFGWHPRKNSTKAANVAIFHRKTYNRLTQGKSILYVTKEPK